MLLVETPSEGRQSVTFNDSFIGTKFFRFICAIGIYEPDLRTKEYYEDYVMEKLSEEMLKMIPH
ncbi:MAG TPA: hypothetical protein VLH59_02480 [Ignavibacteriaceae bacterium]|nr:hypothetical protein [Ignavibacteriaceae bacterium]